MSKQEEKKVYEVLVLRVDQQHITAIRSESYDECYETWEALHSEWCESSDNNRPFVMKKPLITVFNPTLIKEITLVPVVEQAASKNNNPYQQEMINRGLTETLNKYRGQGAPQGDLLDGGYK